MIDDSRRYHRRRRPPLERHFNFGNRSADPTLVSPFGGLPYREARLARQQFSTPLSMGFGFGGGQGSPYGRGGGPLATFINQSRGVLANQIPNSQNLAANLTTGANRAYGGYQQAIDQFMSQLPGFQGTVAGATGAAGEATGAARTALEDAMSPLGSRASFQEASRRALAPAREAAAARGMLEGGQAQAGEQSLLSDLAFQALQTDAERQQNAIAGLSGAAGTQGQLGAAGAQLAGLGPEAMGSLFQAYPQLAQLLTGANQLPMDTSSSLLQFLTAANDPTYSLLRMVLPQVGQTERAFNFGLLSG